MQVLLAEQDREIASEIAHHLIAEHFQVSVVCSGSEVLSDLCTKCYALVILTWMLPDMCSVDLCYAIRQQGLGLPILLLMSQQSPENIVTGLDSGADGYVSLPLDVRLLSAQVRALLRRGSLRHSASVLICEGVEIDLAQSRVKWQGELLGLTHQEYQLLSLFFRHPRQVFSRTEIIQRVWHLEDSPQTGTVANLVKNLRQKIAHVGGEPGMIETVYGMGYRIRSIPEEIWQGVGSS